MKLSAKTDYALKIIYYITTNPDIISAKEIVENSKVPKSLGLRIITELVHGKILKSISGKNGGVFLNNTPDKISFYDVINVMENSLIKDYSNISDEYEDLNIFNPLYKRIFKLKDDFTFSLKSITFDLFIIKENK